MLMLSPSCRLNRSVISPVAQHRGYEHVVSQRANRSRIDYALFELESVGFVCDRVSAAIVDCHKRLRRRLWLVPQTSRIRMIAKNDSVNQTVSWITSGWAALQRRKEPL